VRIKIPTAWPVSFDHRRNLFEEISEVTFIIISCSPLNIQDQIRSGVKLLLDDLGNMV
jgi:hypothetical protein